MSNIKARRVAYRRCRGVCLYCGKPIALPSHGTIDHIIPRSWGVKVSRDAPSGTNITLAHRRCNTWKSVIEGFVADPHKFSFPVEMYPRPSDYYQEVVRRFSEGEAPFDKNPRPHFSQTVLEIMGREIENLRRLSKTHPEIFV